MARAERGEANEVGARDRSKKMLHGQSHVMQGLESGVEPFFGPLGLGKLEAYNLHSGSVARSVL